MSDKLRLQEIRCHVCNKLLLKAVEPYTVEVKCPKCKTLQTQSRTKLIEHPKGE